MRDDDARLLERALALAERGRGTTRPNPVVGALVVRDGRVVGEGWHERPGGPHAEVAALAAAGEQARGATLYTSLEPCAHHGRVGPCTEAIVTAGVARVVPGAGDPFPLVDGRGFGRLRDAGIEVELAHGRLAARARRQNEAFRTWAARGRPFVTYKAAVTLDGRVAASSGDARWVSSEDSRRLVHELRAASDAVAVGMGTVRAESPRLTARDVDAARQPRRLAFGKGPLPVDSDLELLTRPPEEELARLAAEEVQSLLLEGGPTLAGEFLRADLIDKILLFVAPKLIGGDDAPPLFAGAGARTLADAVALSDLEGRSVGEDVLVTAYVHQP
ncbi:MAG: bifunctional diaminohydroxyphosphoribosylaminopyrimidine deaminase/5-amino-6-(5-phosphoribosylamino)uracil reductase RibD [Actinobacteria bacterium]|nr:bifunctional diaminohydroxyphosphoribosylaminopyrimidine deaminase/5-amino-6-(5-phosphoribosylamino)uracil reductase RibD [Actinomycetota bacterium]